MLDNIWFSHVYVFSGRRLKESEGPEIVQFDFQQQWEEQR